MISRGVLVFCVGVFLTINFGKCEDISPCFNFVKQCEDTWAPNIHVINAVDLVKENCDKYWDFSDCIHDDAHNTMCTHGDIGHLDIKLEELEKLCGRRPTDPTTSTTEIFEQDETTPTTTETVEIITTTETSGSPYNHMSVTLYLCATFFAMKAFKAC
ncbi:hypothetical protein Ddc_03737 [Ditylenchus destructor]|nr:hypothetical protein Ddc_03737 [Ditylenchus destructor]